MDEQFPLELPGITPGFFRIDPPTISIKDIPRSMYDPKYGVLKRPIVIYKGKEQVFRSSVFSVFINETKDTDGVMSYRFLIQDIPDILLAAHPESKVKPPPFTGRAPLSPVNTGIELTPSRPEGGYRKHRKTKRKSNKKSNKKSNRNTRSQKRI